MTTTTLQLPSTRTCLDCGAVLPPGRRGFYCLEHGREGNGSPPALVSVVWSSRGRYWAVTVLRCPLCQRKHYHGGGDGPEPAIGSRVAHCDEHDGSYELIETAASIAARVLLYGCVDCGVETAQGESRCSGCVS